MKTNVQIYSSGQEGAPTIPKAIQEMAREWVKDLATKMMKFGVIKISTRPYMVGLRSMLDITFNPVPGVEPPKDIAACRNFMIRHIADEMQLFGIIEIELVPEQSDIQMLNGYWIKIAGGRVADKFGDIQLNIEDDPTGKKVVDEPPKPGAEPGQPEQPAVPAQA